MHKLPPVGGERGEVELLGRGRYAVYGLLGSGTQGETLAAVDRRVGCPVAVKRFRIRGANSWKDVELAEREARVLARLEHAALPRYVDHFEEQGCLYLVMELVEGDSLASLRARGHRFDEAAVVAFLRGAGALLDYLHGFTPPLIHRDIKPGNVLLRQDGSYSFVDFGAVRDSLRPEGGSTVVGTFGYMAPEQFQGRATPSTDVYSVGATALALLTGSEPEALPHRGLAIDVRAALGGRASVGLVTALERMVEPDPDRRAERLLPLLERVGLPRDAEPRGARSREGGAREPRGAWSREVGARERRTRRAQARRRGGPPPVVPLLGIAILRWLLAVVFGRAIPRVLAAVGELEGNAGERTRAHLATLERALSGGLGRLEARLRTGAEPMRASRPEASTPRGARVRVEAIDVPGEDVTDAPPAEAGRHRARGSRVAS